MLLKRMLDECGYEVVTFTSGPSLLDSLKQQKPHLIISDIDMPEMDGFELCRQIKSLPDLQDIPLIYVSSMDRDYVAPRMEQNGAAGFMQKPLAKGSFLDTVAQTL